MIRTLFAVLCLLSVLPLGAAEKKTEKAASAAADGYFLRKGDVVLCLGDSNTENTKWMYLLFYGDLAKQYPELVGTPPPTYTHDAFKGPLTMVNAGVSGDTAAGGAARLPALLTQWKPTACVVCFGMNDRYKDRAGFIGNMKKIVEQLKAAKVEVTLLSPTSTYPINPDLKSFIAVLGEMNQEIAALAAEEHVGYADAYTPAAAWIAAGKPDYTYGDGIHVGDAGQRIMVDALGACWGFGKPLAKDGAPRPAQAIPGGAEKDAKKSATKVSPTKK
jgi:acyl-CoA thioesterase-1